MALYIEAPFPAPEVTIVMPNPKLDNSKGWASDITIIYAMDGTEYSYVRKRGNKKKYLWTFNLSKEKSDELLNFLQEYSSNKVLIDWEGVFFTGYFSANPIELRTTERAGGWPGGELVTMTIEFRESGL